MLIDVSRLCNLLQESDSPGAPASDANQNILWLQPCPFCLGPSLRLNPLRGIKDNFHAAANIATLKEQLAFIRDQVAPTARPRRHETYDVLDAPHRPTVGALAGCICLRRVLHERAIEPLEHPQNHIHPVSSQDIGKPLLLLDQRIDTGGFGIEEICDPLLGGEVGKWKSKFLEHILVEVIDS